MIVLVLNCGSSSIKYQLFDMGEEADVKAKGVVERIGLNDSILTHKPTGKCKFEKIANIPDHTIGINMILDALTHDEHGVISELTDIRAVGHRVAHGGEFFTESVLVDDNVKNEIEKCIELAPLHNPANLKGILSMESLLPDVPQIAVFDTSFHQTMPEKSYLYAIPYKYYEKYKIRRYGFHGTSHKFVARKACKQLGWDMNEKKIITCHLGNGASIAAIQNGQSVDTSMGFTPVDGLIMGTRSGSIDPGVIMYIADKENLNMKGVSNLINKESGMTGISGISSDMRDIESAVDQGNKRAKLALDMYSWRVKKFIGAYAAVMGGVDLIIFTGGIGENDYMIREMISSDMEFLGVEFDKDVNTGLRGEDKILTKEGSKTLVMSITTNEELVIATDTMKIVNKCF